MSTQAAESIFTQVDAVHLERPAAQRRELVGDDRGGRRGGRRRGGRRRRRPGRRRRRRQGRRAAGEGAPGRVVVQVRECEPAVAVGCGEVPHIDACARQRRCQFSTRLEAWGDLRWRVWIMLCKGEDRCESCQRCRQWTAACGLLRFFAVVCHRHHACACESG